jgi:hypothetical protein
VQEKEWDSWDAFFVGAGRKLNNSEVCMLG